MCSGKLTSGFIYCRNLGITKPSVVSFRFMTNLDMDFSECPDFCFKLTEKWLPVPGMCWSHVTVVMEFTGFQFMGLEVPLAHCFALWNSRGLTFSLSLLLTWGYFFRWILEKVEGKVRDRNISVRETDWMGCPTHIPIRCQGLNLQPRYMPLTRINLR